MTVKTAIKNKISGYIGIFIFLFLTALVLIYAEETRNSVIFGIKLSALSIIPSIFPFFILSDLLISSFDDSSGIFAKIFSKVFNISPVALPVFIIGLLSGFPLGVKGASDLYSENKITKEECEVLSGFVNNPSIAFVVSGVGISMLGSISLGFILYFSVVISSIIVGCIFKPELRKSLNFGKNTEQNFNLSKSIKSAGMSSITVSAYIIFFSMLTGLITAAFQNEVLTALLSCLLEVGNATKILSNGSVFSPALSFALIAFSLGFSGISVFMQAESYLPTEICRIKILVMKIAEGVLSAIFAALIFIVTK